MPTNKKEYNRKYYQEHKEHRLAYHKKYYEKHKEELLAYAKKARDSNPEYHAEWQRKNKEKLNAIKTRYRKKLALHKKRVKQAKSQYRDSKGRFCKL